MFFKNHQSTTVNRGLTGLNYVDSMIHSAFFLELVLKIQFIIEIIKP